jgi:hypothetical protein
MADRKGILLNTDFDISIKPKYDSNGKILTGFTIGATVDQEVVLVLKMSQGELKEDPLLGAGLTKFIRGKFSNSAIEHRIKQHLTRARIDYDEYKNKINANIKNS